MVDWTLTHYSDMFYYVVEAVPQDLRDYKAEVFGSTDHERLQTGGEKEAKPAFPGR